MNDFLVNLVAAAPSRRQEQSDFFSMQYAVENPTPINGFEFCEDEDCDNGRWQALFSGHINSVCNDGPPLPTTVGYRRTGDDSTSAIYKCDDSIQPLIYHRTVNGDIDLGVFWRLDVSQQWPTSATKRDFSQVKFPSGIFSVVNSECDFGQNIAITTVDAAGVTNTIEGVDDLRTEVPRALPANVTVVVNGGDSHMC
ncbi:hypothetical protein D9758_012125 [Tetrapyrgos nigripes]|uniref:Uncharacterized protein n=1 Tax=Tetrapyrgos nigripes TaxID=182062 RepID=A0A8H5FP36_9AGAR|nr:hypothetical protein D9758_012125 [Tetrapyrgos nigripes]